MRLDLGRVGGSIIQLSSIAGSDAGEIRVLEDPPIQKLHNVKRRANHVLVVTHGIGFWYRNIRSIQGPQNAEFSSHIVGSLRDKGSRRFLAEDKLVLVGIRYLIRRV